MPSWYWLVWAIVSASFALIGALIHSLGLIVWNLLWLGLYIYLFEKARE